MQPEIFSRRSEPHEPPSIIPPASEALIRALSTHPEQIANLIEALHRRASDADTLVNLMGRVGREAVQLPAGVKWAGITAQFDGSPSTATHTARVLVVDERQYAADGDCAYRRCAAARSSR